MKSFITRNQRVLFYAAWLAINLIQIAYTGLLDDEAYYWVYSRFPDWGYFDHPPMVALMIRAGYAMFPSPFGVRLFTVLMSTATLYLMDLLLEKRNNRLFYAIAASLFVFQVGGIITVPDLPLMFFTALFFIAYRHFLSTTSAISSALLGIAVALMLYSKYHGVLIVFFTLASNPGLLLRWRTWLAALVAAVLFLPHLLWQVSHGLPSVYYHLFERNANSYRFSFTSEYILGQLALTGPLIGWLLLFALFRIKPANALEKAMKWTSIGVFAIFLLATFKGRAEANWTVPAFIGMVVLAHRFLTERPSLSKWVYRLLWPILLLIFVVRIYMMADVVPARWLKKDEFHKTREWALAIKDSAHGLPVVFVDSYQKPSQYWFWSGDTSYGLNTARYRRNNYNFWPLEKQLQGKPVFLVSDSGTEILTERSNIPSRKIYGLRVDSFYSHAQVAVRMLEKVKQEGGVLVQEVIISAEEPAAMLRPVMILYNANNQIASLLSATPHHKTNGHAYLTVSVNGVPPGSYSYKWGMESCLPGRPSLNSIGATVLVH